jgi:ribosomal-protein-serine acetyltransferase
MGENIMFKIDIDDNLHIEFLNHTHAQKLFEVVDKNREHLKRWLPWVESTTKVEDTKEFITHALSKYAKNGSIQAPIHYNNKLIGMVSLFVHKSYNLDKADIGYWIDKDYNGKGIVTKCANKMLDIGFNIYNLGKITIHCATDNYNSCNVAKRLKFTFDGTLRKEAKVSGKIEDLNIYSMLKEEYEKIKV